MATAATALNRAATAPPNDRRQPSLEAVPLPRREEPLADGTLSARWLEAWLGVKPSQLEALQADGELLAIRGATGELAYPVWQFGPDGSVLPGARRVVAAAAAADIEPARLHKLMAARVGLAGGGHLAGLLREGRVDHVVSIVRAAGSDA